MKNEAVVQSQAVSLRNLENQIGQFATTLSNRPQGSLSSNTEDPRRDGKEHWKVINLRYEKDVDIPIRIPRKEMKHISSSEELQVEKELQQPSYQNISESSQAIVTT